MKLENQVCSLEQADKLKNLGVIQESYFYYAGLDELDDFKPAPHRIVSYKGQHWNSSAFTVAELGVMLPDAVEDMRGTPFILEIGKAAYTYSVQYWDRCSSDSKGYLLPRTRDPLLAVCMADMLIHLLENNHITPTSVNQRLSND